MKYVATIKKIIELEGIYDRLVTLEEGITKDVADTIEEILSQEIADRAQKLYDWQHDETLTKEVRRNRKCQLELACRLLNVERRKILRYRTW